MSEDTARHGGLSLSPLITLYPQSRIDEHWSKVYFRLLIQPMVKSGPTPPHLTSSTKALTDRPRIFFLLGG